MTAETIIAEYPPPDGREWDCNCARCGSSMEHVDCDHCDDGFDGHDCGEDCCCCAYPEDNVPCDICRGHGGWWQCLSSPEWCQGNPIKGRENIQRGQIEWYTFEKKEKP